MQVLPGSPMDRVQVLEQGEPAQQTDQTRAMLQPGRFPIESTAAAQQVQWTVPVAHVLAAVVA